MVAEMSPTDVPSELMEAGFEAIRAWYRANPNPNRYLSDRVQMQEVLAAVLPLHEQRVREQIAGELYGLPIAQHLGIPHSNATQHAVDVAEAAQRWMITVIQRPDLVPESVRDEAHLSARVRENPAWPADLPKLRGCDCPTGGGNA